MSSESATVQGSSSRAGHLQPYGAARMGDDLLQVRDLAIDIVTPGHRQHVLHGVSFGVRPASTVALVGESGSGKSITAQSILQILPQAARVARGEVLLQSDGPGEPPLDLLKLRPHGPRMRAIRGGRISIVFQEPMAAMSPVHTIGDQIGETLSLHRTIGRGAVQETVLEMLRLVGFPEPARAVSMYPFELSGGLRQRAMLAMALICRPGLLIADEPTTALDVTIQAQILKLVRELQDELRMAVLMITHDLGVVANLAEDVVVMYEGRVVEAGPTAELLENPRHGYLQALMRAVPRFQTGERNRLQPIREVSAKVGEVFEHWSRAEQTAPATRNAAPMLKVEGLVKRFRRRKTSLVGSKADTEVTAVDGVSFEIPRGGCFGLLGESGCGKTTLSKLLMRALTPDAGAVTFDDGRDTRDLDVLALEGSELQAFRRRMQFVFQDPHSSLDPRMSVFDILREPLQIHGLGDRAYQARLGQELMRLVGLDPRFLARYPHSFSGGQRQRIGIARALALQPDILLLDEPVSALDVSIQAQILNLLHDLRQRLGLTYMFISHNLAVVHYLADRIGVMCKGQLVEVAGRDQLFRNPQHPYTRNLLEAVPYPDPARPLDMSKIELGGHSDPAGWPAPYRRRPSQPCRMVEIEADHLVAQSADG